MLKLVAKIYKILQPMNIVTFCFSVLNQLLIKDLYTTTNISFKNFITFATLLFITVIAECAIHSFIQRDTILLC